MARNNFQYEKRQRELEKKRKADEKARRKSEAKNTPGEGEAPEAAGDTDQAGSADSPDDDRQSATGVAAGAVPSSQA